MTLYLPSRRAVREVQSAFLATREGEAAMLLPRLRPLGDVDEEDLLAAGTPTDAETSLAPAAEGIERRLVLARFVRQARAAEGLPVPAWPAALMAADELGRVLDEFHTAGVDFGQLMTLAHDVADGAAHWAHSLKFLSVVTEQWPALLTTEGRVDGALRRRQLLDALTEGASDEGGPVIVAGSLGTIPATARFMARVAAMPRGAVVLPGLDLGLDDEAWAQIEPPHPQALFKTLLERHFGDMPRGEVRAWPCPADAQGSRRGFLSLILRPAEATDDWHGRMTAFRREDDVARATTGLRTAVATSEDEEAGFVALLMRETLETPGADLHVGHAGPDACAAGAGEAEDLGRERGRLGRHAAARHVPRDLPAGGGTVALPAVGPRGVVRGDGASAVPPGAEEGRPRPRRAGAEPLAAGAASACGLRRLGADAQDGTGERAA